MVVFKLKENYVEVHTEKSTFLGVIVPGEVKHITYEQFYNLLKDNQERTEQNPFQLYSMLLDFFETSSIEFPKDLVYLKSTEQGLVCTQILGGGGQKLFPENDADTSRIRVDFLIDNERNLVRNSIVAYRYRGIKSVGIIQAEQCTPLPTLTAVIKDILRTNKAIRAFHQADVQRFIKRIPQRTAHYAQLETYFNQNTEIPWEEI